MSSIFHLKLLLLATPLNTASYKFDVILLIIFRLKLNIIFFIDNSIIQYKTNVKA